MASVPGFLTKTFEIFSSPEFADCCGWGANGDTIVIKKIEQFSKEVVPKFFKHSNFQSFVRQLNMYDFHKTVQDPSHGEFAHEFFKKGKPELLVHIKRKANKTPAATQSKSGKSGKSGASNSSGGGPSTSTRSSSATNTALVPGTGASVKAAAGGAASNSGNSSHNTGTNSGIVAPLSSVGAPSSSGASAVNSYSYLADPDPLYSSSGGIDLDDSLGVSGGLQYFVDEGTGHPYPVTGGAGNGSGTGGAGGAGSGGGGYYDPYAVHPLLPDDIATETDHLLMELNQQRALRESFERRMEQKLAALEGENNMLKRMFMESHHKNAVMQERMERVMKTLYNLFVGGGNAPGLALTGRMPSMLLTDIEHFSDPAAGEGSEAARAGATDREVTVLDDGSGGDRSSAGVGGGIITRSNSALGPTATRALASVPYEGGTLDRSRSSDSAAYLSRFDSATLERLPSLDLAELDTLSAVPAEPVLLNGRNGGSSSSAFSGAPQRGGGGANAQFAHLLRRPYAGASLSAESRGNSFDIAASSVTAPSMLRQGSFDSAYLLPLPGTGEGNGSAANPAGSPSGRLFLQPGNGIADLDRGTGVSVGGPLAGAPLSRPPRPSLSPAAVGPDAAVPLMRQRTFDYTPPAAGTDTASAQEGEGGSGTAKRKSGGGAGEDGQSAEQDFKRAKVESTDTDIEGELRHLQSEDVHSSLSEAQQFMDLLNRNQQTTLTRLDSLEMTIASLFDSANGTQASAASASPEPRPSDSHVKEKGAQPQPAEETGPDGAAT